MANLVFTEDGLEWLVKRAFDPATALGPALALAIGSGGTTPAPTDPALVAETARAAAVFEYVSPGVFKLSATFAAGVGTGTVAEVGIFDDEDDDEGTLIARALIGPFTKAAGAEYVCELPVSLVDANA